MILVRKPLIIPLFILYLLNFCFISTCLIIAYAFIFVNIIKSTVYLFCYNYTMKVVLLAAGMGSRLWPLSTSDQPKQFQPIIFGETPLQYTFNLMQKVSKTEDLYVLVLDGMENIVKKQLPYIKSRNIISVPERRNTFPHSIWALKVISDRPDEMILFKSVDQYVENENEFVKSVVSHIDAVSSSTMTTLFCTEAKQYNSNDGYCIVKDKKISKFIEKPSKVEFNKLDRKSLLRSPMIYTTSINSILEIIDSFESEWSATAKEFILGVSNNVESEFLKLPFLDISSNVFQKTNNLHCKNIEYEFVDVGRFEEIYDLNTKDDKNNVVIGEVLEAESCTNCLLINTTRTPTVVMSESDKVVVSTESGVFVAPLNESHIIGDIYKNRILPSK